MCRLRRGRVTALWRLWKRRFCSPLCAAFQGRCETKPAPASGGFPFLEAVGRHELSRRLHLIAANVAEFRWPRIRCRIRLSRSSAGSDLSSSKASISRAASFKAVRAASLDGGRRLDRRRLFRRCLAKTFSINEVSERRSRATAFPAASFGFGSILKVICAVFFWRMIPTSLASQNQRYGSPFAHSEPVRFRKPLFRFV